ncbi:nucleoside-diphosphate sugar epimerase/dehydratase [Proteiniborus sp. MB09-C3]|uniref:polysaccharide biosynthesis protein n=1 Tax=Proteiniborus sp. MB09-C3 TaxID=3050072 RepID=UPI002555B385|nr:nucleoside-diphosphate sugar epimerase/dehydratase [Proteiniborus sp. MB09-C3]WIV12099.1 nucleoside-diphosphate sugar epimerase/dehydratase [Proteiniborus sp. MB09-C3]
MQKKARVIFLILLDAFLINLSYYIALYLRFDGNIEANYLKVYINNALIITLLKIIVFHYFKLYKSLWRYASIDELLNVVVASIVANAGVISYLFALQTHLPRGVYAITIMLDMLLIGGVRFSYRALRRVNGGILSNGNGYKHIMIIGAGDAGAMVIRELKNHTQLNSRPVAIIDDDFLKEGQRINGVPVMGRRVDIATIADKMNIDEIIIAIPSASKSEIRSIVNECKKTKCKLKILPGMYELIDGKVSIKEIREVQIEDLLGRDEINLDIDEISGYLKGKRVLVTGGGGSIGSELCRQIAKFNPNELCILDIYENNAYDLQNELKRKYEDLNLRVFIASIRDKKRIDEIMKDIRPDVIFHAAAHKHVPLMEDNPKEAIKNNVFGTLNLAQAADTYGVKRFVMISTDKAVNPTNIMGASKRICEMIIQSIDKKSETEFVAVRFGNVLGSNGSVIPLFKKQIMEGGPVTVTHPEIIRYFMTIPEAAQLVIQAGAMAKGGEIFVLDMGEPVKIIDLARDLIKLSGFEPDADIPIVFTGLRQGEKLFEELLLDEEGIQSTAHEKIFIGKPIFADYKLMLKSIDTLKEIIDSCDGSALRDYVQQIVPTYNKNNTGDTNVSSNGAYVEVSASR